MNVLSVKILNNKTIQLSCLGQRPVNIKAVLVHLSAVKHDKDWDR